MKKLFILLFSILFISTSTIYGQTETTDNVVEVAVDKDVNEVKKCTKTGKICDNACKNKKNGTCCNANKTKSSCSKSKKGSFNFNKSNNYGGEKSSCNKTVKKSCCKKKIKKCSEDCTKACCTKTEESTEKKSTEE